MVFENVPVEPSENRGRDSVRRQLEGAYGACTEIVYEVLARSESGGTVLTERIDRHLWDDGARADIRVMGRFDVVDGRITLWRDYFDAEQWHRNFDGGFVAYLGRRATRDNVETRASS